MKIVVQISPTQLLEFQQLQSSLKLSPEKVLEHAVQLLAWAVREKQAGRTVVGFQRHPPTVQILDMPALNRVRAEVDVDATPLSELPQLIAEKMRCLVEEGHVEEAIEAAAVERRLDRVEPLPSSDTHNDPTRIQSAMILEAAKFMAEEGEPATAVKLIQEVRKRTPQKRKPH